MMTYAVEIEIELGEFTYVRKENPWTEDHKVWIFNNRGEAEEEAKRWNTGRVVPYTIYGDANGNRSDKNTT